MCVVCICVVCIHAVYQCVVYMSDSVCYMYLLGFVWCMWCMYV